MMLSILGSLAVMLALTATADAQQTYDIVVYGGTSSAVIAAVQAKKMGKSVVIVSPDTHLGGLSSGGLGFTDTGNKAVIGGLSRDFYHRVWQHYERAGAWRWEKKEDYGNAGQGTPAIDGANRTMWIFEPHVAERVFEDYVKQFAIPVARNEWLDRTNGVHKNGARIAAIRTLSGKTYAGRMFIDATYEGDLMAAAGVAYHVGREANSVYGEQWNGVQVGVLHHGHHFGRVQEKISPYVVPDDPTSGVLPRISTASPGTRGEGDRRVQAYTFRMCLTNHPANRIPFQKPDGYDPKQYELLLRIFYAGWRETFEKFDPIPNRKTDTNNHGPFSFDNIGFNWDYPEASYERRREIIKEHETYQKGLLFFIANDPRVPPDVQAEMRTWGLPRDEFQDNGHWSRQLYIREARRMIGHVVMTEHELLKQRPTPESVGMGSYTIDSHNVQRYITPEGYVQNEGDIGVGLKEPYAIAYGALVPQRGQADNLLVSVAVSSSHIAYGSIRMEPVFMILGQSAATAAAVAIEGNVAVQDVPYATLRRRLLADGQVLEYAAPAPQAQGRRVRLLVATAAQPAPRVVDALLPDTLRAGERVRVVYVLPVEADTARIYGSGLDEVARLGLQNRYHIIAVAPTFAQVPWYGDHATDPAVRQEHYFVNDVVPAVDRQLPTVAAPHGRLLLGFSKSGWGAFTLLLRNPEVFGGAVAWDAPLMMTALGQFETSDVFGNEDTFARYRVSTLLRERGVRVGQRRRLVLLGHGLFHDDVRATHALMDSLGVVHLYREGPARAHRWASGWLPDAFALLVGAPAAGKRD